MRRGAIAITFLLLGCHGAPQRFSVKSLALLPDPVVDLDGDGERDNQLGQIAAALRAQELLDEEVAGACFIEIDANREATLRVPFFRDAAPLEVRATIAQVVLDGETRAGRLDGAVRIDELLRALFPGFDQMLRARPAGNPTRILLLHYLDSDGDGTIARDEFAESPIVRAILAPDLGDSLSLSLSFNLVQR